MYRVNDKKSAFPFLLYPLQAFLNEEVSLLEVTSLFIHKMLLALFKLRLVYEIICDRSEPVPA
jgi:hypothetical protein